MQAFPRLALTLGIASHTICHFRQNLEEKITAAISQVVREKAPDALSRVAQILQTETGKMPTPPVVDYLTTIGNTPMVNLKNCLPPDFKVHLLGSPPSSPKHGHISSA